MFLLASFNRRNVGYQIVLDSWKREAHYWDEVDNHSKANIAWVANIVVREGMYLAPLHTTRTVDIPIQLIGTVGTNERTRYSDDVMRSFDLSCVKFSIDNPDKPTEVRWLNDSVHHLFMQRQTTYSLTKLTRLDTICSRIKKYMERGFEFIGFEILDNIQLKCSDAEIVDLAAGTISNGAAMHLSDVFTRFRECNGILVKPSHVVSVERYRSDCDEILKLRRERAKRLKKRMKKRKIVNSYAKLVAQEALIRYKNKQVDLDKTDGGTCVSSKAKSGHLLEKLKKQHQLGLNLTEGN